MEYRGVLGTLSTMVRTEGLRSLYSGLVAGLQRQMSFASIRIGLYDSVKQLYTPKGAESECGAHQDPSPCGAAGANPIPELTPWCPTLKCIPNLIPWVYSRRHGAGGEAAGGLHHGRGGGDVRPTHRRGQGAIPGSRGDPGQRPALQRHRGRLQNHRQGGGSPRALER